MIDLSKEKIPNLLTISRIIAIPVLVGLLYIPLHITSWIALVLYTAMCITDYLDGYLARKWQVTSPIGTFLDPIADKILVAALLLVFVDLGRLPGFWMLPVIIILARELLISGLREYLGAKDVKVPVSFIAKWKTAIQMIALGFLMIGHISNDYLFIGWGGILLAAGITAYTGYAYIKAAWGHLSGKAPTDKTEQ
ncbi:MAG: CDP-diacylglycerol--glycerol-3-phosphate 3-phosphatidyltransferase [Rhodospirillales bacterium]|nr:CDP-diacylglycerol--glycerol-3-phosphate 3-phosphatidyltransferase [Rhodospirillales bacterium]